MSLLILALRPETRTVKSPLIEPFPLLDPVKYGHKATISVNHAGMVLIVILFECMSKDLCLRCGAGKPLLSTTDGGRGAAAQWVLHAAN